MCTLAAPEEYAVSQWKECTPTVCFMQTSTINVRDSRRCVVLLTNRNSNNTKHSLLLPLSAHSNESFHFEYRIQSACCPMPLCHDGGRNWLVCGLTMTLLCPSSTVTPFPFGGTTCTINQDHHRRQIEKQAFGRARSTGQL